MTESFHNDDRAWRTRPLRNRLCRLSATPALLHGRYSPSLPVPSATCARTTRTTATLLPARPKSHTRRRHFPPDTTQPVRPGNHCPYISPQQEHVSAACIQIAACVPNHLRNQFQTFLLIQFTVFHTFSSLLVYVFDMLFLHFRMQSSRFSGSNSVAKITSLFYKPNYSINYFI